MSGRGTHQVGGAVAGLLVGQVGASLAGWPLPQVVAVAVVAAATGGGKLSPDIDQGKAWRTLDRWVPDEWLGGGGPLQHRGLSHWWGTVVAMAVWWVVLHAALPPGPGAVAVAVVGVGQVTGWVSHLVLDGICGKAVHAPDGALIVRRGIPMAPWWAHRGGLIRSGDIGSQTIGILLGLVALGQVALLVASAGTP